MDAFSMRLPALVIAQLLGVPADDHPGFVARTRDILAQDDQAKAHTAYPEMAAYVEELVLRKEKEPVDDLVGGLVVRMAAGELSRDEAVGVARMLMGVDFETTAHQIGLSAVSLLTDGRLRAKVFADDGRRLPQLIEESLRYWSQSQGAIVRLDLEDAELGGTRITAGDALVLSIPAANHAAAVFPDAHRFDVDRDTRTDLQWGVGVHRCPALPLARVQIESALRALFGRFPGLRLDCEPSRIEFLTGTIFYGLKHLPVRWRDEG